MRIFITGGNGFVGKRVLQNASAKGYKVIALTRNKEINGLPVYKNVKWVTGNISGDLREHLHGCSFVLHLASSSTLFKDQGDWQKAIETNVEGTLNLLEEGSKAGIKMYGICGSYFEYGLSCGEHAKIPPNAELKPTNAYGASKAAQSIICCAYARERKLKLGIMRLFHIYGEGEHESRFWPSLRRAARDGLDFNMSPGGQVKDIIDVGMAGSAIINNIEVIARATPGMPIALNIGGGVGKSLKEFAEEEWRRLDAEGVLRIGELSYRNDEIMHSVANIEQISHG